MSTEARAVTADKFRGFVIAVLRVTGDDGLPHYTAVAKDPLGAHANEVTQWCPGDYHGTFHSSIEGAIVEIRQIVSRELNALTE